MLYVNVDATDAATVCVHTQLNLVRYSCFADAMGMGSHDLQGEHAVRIVEVPGFGHVHAGSSARSDHGGDLRDSVSE